ncbi:hypothetical protein PIB30_056605 [Stylosanthes scabra]|uniref:Uncharacterized protein n=1 Tax=Stylosanthes scabra TaxID=79078 RepID=A0ABU6VJN3_9FABA|nr:hypothetical protein [Stylosanthes scabra]
MQALIPYWMRSQGEVYTWRSAVPVMCFNFVHMHHIDRVIRQYGGEQPIPRSPVDVTRHRRTPKVLVTVHDGDLHGTQQYYEWYVRVARSGRFLSRAWDLSDARWNLAPPDIPPTAMQLRNELVMPDDALAPRRRGGQ